MARRQLKHRDRNRTREPLQPEIAPERPQERFLFVSTGPFREEFRERPFGGPFTKGSGARVSQDRRRRFPPRFLDFPPLNETSLCRRGEMGHIDVKELGRIPDGGGWRAQPGQPAPTTQPGRFGSVMTTCTLSSTTTPASPTPKCTPTKRASRLSPFSSALAVLPKEVSSASDGRRSREMLHRPLLSSER